MPDPIDNLIGNDATIAIFALLFCSQPEVLPMFRDWARKTHQTGNCNDPKCFFNLPIDQWAVTIDKTIDIFASVAIHARGIRE